MRKITILFFILFSLNVQSQVPDYFANNPTWYCGIWDSDQWNFPAEPFTEEYLYYLDGDTVALGYTYHRVFRKGYRNLEITPQTIDETFDEQTEYYIRQVGRTIRYYTVTINTDSLLISYEYNVGDTVAGNIFQLCHSNDTIQKIDSILINSEYRKIFYLDSLNGPVITEGIGNQNQISGSSGEFLLSLCSGIGFDYFVNCYGQNNIPMWDPDGNGGSCYLNLAMENIPEIVFEIRPNPTSNQFTVYTISETQLKIEIIDLEGKTVLRTNERTISTEQFEKGIYLIVVTDLSGNTSRTKLVIV
jgi:hypothetical protein